MPDALVCADFKHKLKEVILVHHYDLFLPSSVGHVSTNKAGFFFAFQLFFTLLWLEFEA